ncbi:MAG: DUF4238 domain-containing protein [Fulvivirga sp.]
MSKVKTQHYVPRFYLEEFSSNEQIWAFDKTNKNVFKSNISNVASENYFYDSQTLDELSGEQFIEKTLSGIEGILASKLRSIIARINEQQTRYKIDEADRIALSELFLVQLIRTKEMRNNMELSKKTLLEELHTKGFTDTSAYIDSEINSKDDHLKFIITALAKTESYDVMYDKVWVVYYNTSKHKFYTSDSPTCKHMHDDITPNIYELFMPLSPTIGVSALSRQNRLHPLELRTINISNTENVKFLNSLTIYNSHRFIFNKFNDFKLAESVMRNNPDLAKIGRPRFKIFNL